MRRPGPSRASLVAMAVLLAGPALTGCADQIAEPGGRVGPTAGAESGDLRTTGPSASADAAVQEQLLQVVEDIEQDREGQEIPGYAGLEIMVETHTVTAYWVGEPPEHVRRIAASPPAGVTVDLRPAGYDLAAMLTAIEKVFDTFGDHLHGASPHTEGDGITVEQTAADAQQGPTVADLTAAAGMPVTVEIGEPPQPAAGG